MSILTLNHLLEIAGVDFRSRRVLVMRHRPTEPELRATLPWFAVEEPEVYNVYQQTQNPTAERALTRANYLVSCIGHRPREALFVGIYEVKGSQPLTYEQYWELPENLRLRSAGLTGFTRDRQSVLRFNLVLNEALATWKGKLVLEWVGGERSWFRWANRNDFPVAAISEDSLLVSEIPSWDELILTWQELQALPRSWQAALRQWRGIYFIMDRSDGKGYVGSATGSENLLGRWKNYNDGHGGNSLLRNRYSDDLVFSILQLVAPSAPREHVLIEETKWKRRLHTRILGLNDN